MMIMMMMMQHYSALSFMVCMFIVLCIRMTAQMYLILSMLYKNGLKFSSLTSR